MLSLWSLAPSWLYISYLHSDFIPEFLHKVYFMYFLSTSLEWLGAGGQEFLSVLFTSLSFHLEQCLTHSRHSINSHGINEWWVLIFKLRKKEANVIAGTLERGKKIWNFWKVRIFCITPTKESYTKKESYTPFPHPHASLLCVQFQASHSALHRAHDTRWKSRRALYGTENMFFLFLIY